MKIMANKKKRREKGVRAEFFGSKPHSKGVAALRSRSARVASTSLKINKVKESMMETRTRVANVVIDLRFYLFRWLRHAMVGVRAISRNSEKGR